jgi:ribulose-5-phosphate 4-epimerase/fuculose-1-phosphate aldolase
MLKYRNCNDNLKDPVEPHTFWVNPFGVAWPTLKASDLIRVDGAGQVVDGGPVRLLNAAGQYSHPSIEPNSVVLTVMKTAYFIHHAVHTARPDVNCVAHSHSLYGRTFSTFGASLDITTQDSCAFYDDLALYSSFRGVVLGADEGHDIAAALGNKKAAILQNHGLMTCAKTIEAAVFWFRSLERCCHTQLLADAAAKGRDREVRFP